MGYRTSITQQEVVAFISEERIEPLTPLQIVRVVTAVQFVVAAAAQECVVTGCAIYLVIPVTVLGSSSSPSK